MRTALVLFSRRFTLLQTLDIDTQPEEYDESEKAERAVDQLPEEWDSTVRAEYKGNSEYAEAGD